MGVESRIRRWTGSDEWQRVVETSHSPVAARGTGALDAAAAAVAAARTDLHRAFRRRRLDAWLEAALGASGLAGLVAIAVLGPTGLGPAMGGTAALATCTLLAALPLCRSLHRATASRCADGIAALETARALEARLIELCGDAATTDALVDEVEATSAALAGRAGRRHRRYKVVDDHVLVTTHAGATIRATLIDVSVSGAAISCDIPDVRVGDTIQVGSRAAKVVRTLERGFACAFLGPAPAAAGLAAA